MRWHKATETPKNGERCILRVILDTGKTEITMGTAFVNTNLDYYWSDMGEMFWEIESVKSYCPVSEIERELDLWEEEERVACLYQYLLGGYTDDE